MCQAIARVMPQISNRTAQLCLKYHSSSLLHSFQAFDLFPFFPHCIISLSFLTDQHLLFKIASISCLRLFFVVGLFGFFIKKTLRRLILEAHSISILDFKRKHI